MTDETPTTPPPSGPTSGPPSAQPHTSGPSAPATSEPPATSAPSAPATSAPSDMPDYKGAPLDPERGPGLGCFWAQVILLVLLLVLTPLSVYASAPSWLSAAMLILVLVLLFFVGQTMIFLLRLVAADRRTRRGPMATTARPTVGQMEDATTTVPVTPHSEVGAESQSDEDDATPDEPLT